MKSKLFLVILILACANTACKKKKPTPIPPEESGTPAVMSMWKDQVMGAIYNPMTNSVAYNKPDNNGLYKIYTSNIDGTNETAITYAGWPTDRQQWAEEWDPTGQYLFCYIEKTTYATETGHTRKPEDAIPGYGAYTDLWIVKRDGSQAWQLTNLANDYDHGIIHGAVSKDGTLFAWTERIQAPVFLDPNLSTGAYVFRVADVSYGATPTLSNIRTLQPGGVLAGGEVESISADNTNVLCYSTFECKNIITTPIYKIDIASGATTKLTTESFSQSPTYTPNGQHIVYMTGRDCDIFFGQLQGADWWIMDPDGNNKRRLTFMNKKDNPQSVNAYRLAGSLSFINDSTFFGGIMTKSIGLEGYTALVKFKL